MRRTWFFYATIYEWLWRAARKTRLPSGFFKYLHGDVYYEWISTSNALFSVMTDGVVSYLWITLFAMYIFYNVIIVLVTISARVFICCQTSGSDAQQIWFTYEWGTDEWLPTVYRTQKSNLFFIFYIIVTECCSQSESTVAFIITRAIVLI